jgi:hypothetical protein
VALEDDEMESVGECELVDALFKVLEGLCGRQERAHDEEDKL